MLIISRNILAVLHDIENETIRTSAKKEIMELATQFPVPGIDV